MLRKEPLKVSSEIDEDDTICERCSHILAICFSKTKKKDNYKLQEVEEPRAVPRLIENSGSELRLAPQVDWIQSRLGSQHEQPKWLNQGMIFNMNSQKWLDQSLVLNMNSQEWLDQGLVLNMNSQEWLDQVLVLNMNSQKWLNRGLVLNMNNQKWLDLGQTLTTP